MTGNNRFTLYQRKCKVEDCHAIFITRHKFGKLCPGHSTPFGIRNPNQTGKPKFRIDMAIEELRNKILSEELR